MNASDLREILGADIINYQQLVDSLRSYKKPRDKVTRLIAGGDLIRIRKGLYIFGKKLRRTPVDRYLIANLIYGPSYISFETALSYYGFIPERVESVASVTTGKSKKFMTPLGLFTYWKQPSSYYSAGATLKKCAWGNILLATPEKALADQLLANRSAKISNQQELEDYLTEDLRIDRDQLLTITVARLQKIACISGHPLMKLLVQYIQKIKKL